MKISIYFLSILFFISCSTSTFNEKKSYTEFKKRTYTLGEEKLACNDFYQYVCGNTIDQFKLPKTRSRHNFSFDDINEYLLDQKKIYFENIKSSKVVNPREQQLQDYYLACIDEKNAKVNGKKFIEETINKVNSLSNHQDFKEYLYNEFKQGNPSFISFWTNLPNFNNSENMDVYIAIDTISLPDKSYYENSALITDLNELISSFFKAINIDKAEGRAKNVLDFEINLAKVYPSQVEINKNVFSITELKLADQKKLKNLKIVDFYSNLPSKPHFRNLYGSPAYQFINDSLDNLELDTLKSIYLFHALKHFIDDASPDFYKKMMGFKSKHFGAPSEKPKREEFCTNEIKNQFGMELDSFLFPKIFPNIQQDKIKNMIKKIQNNMIKTIKQNEWLSQDAKNAAVRKLTHANIRLIAPESEIEWNFNKIGKYSNKDLSANRLQYRQLQFQKSLENLNLKFKVPLWDFGPLTVNAALIPPYNAIIFPASMFMPPFYDSDLPEEVNMAAIGTVIGHELGHMVDDKGYTFDYKGRLKPWIKDQDKKMFSIKTKPLVEQFSSIGHNGEFTLGENIGDLVGLTNSYQTAFPQGSFDQNKTKQFFIQYAKLWCEKQKPETAKLRLKIDPHSLGYARANEQVKHQRGFAKAFNCTKDDSLVIDDQKKIKIW